MQVLIHLCRHLDRTPLGMLAALRPWPEGAMRECLALELRGEAVVKRLAPLDAESALTFVGDSVGRALTPDEADAIVDLCGGNPLLLDEVAAALADGDAGSGQAAARMVEPLVGRLGGIAGFVGLPAAARVCLEAASVLGRRFRPEVALDIAQLDEAEGYQALDVMCRLGLLRQGPGRALEFSQPLVQQLVYLGMTPPVRMRLHTRAFDALTQRGFERRAAEHALHGDLARSDAAIDLLARAGRSALLDGAAARAAAHFRDALALASDRASADLRLSLGRALLRAGHPAATARVVARMLREQDVDVRTRVFALRLLGCSHVLAGRSRSAMIRLGEAATLARHGAPDAVADALVEQAMTTVMVIGVDAGRELLDRARVLTGPAQDEVHHDIAVLDSALRVLAAEHGAIDELQERALRLMNRPLVASDGEDRLPALATVCGIALTASARLDVAHGFFGAALKQVRERGFSGATAGLLALHADVLTRLGRLKPASTAVEAAVAAAREAPGQRALALAIRAHVLLHLDRGEESARFSLEAGRRLQCQEDPLAAIWMDHVAGLRALLDGDLSTAASRYAHIAAEVERLGVTVPGLIPWEGPALLALVGTRQREAASTLAARLEERGRTLARADARAIASLGLGLIAEQSQRPDLAMAHLREAATLADASEAVLDRVWVLWHVGSALRRTGHGLEARRALARSLALAERSGAAMLARVVTRELDVARGGRARRATDGPLTPQESRVVELAASGRSNREIAAQLWLSVNTVETHLQRAYAKLGVRTRTQLAARVAAGSPSAMAAESGNVSTA
ncbi:MAG TPA: LuxR C-terminal-related transcriptional regulator [Candidatus Dormibacteraeota bacterium]